MENNEQKQDLENILLNELKTENSNDATNNNSASTNIDIYNNNNGETLSENITNKTDTERIATPQPSATGNSEDNDRSYGNENSGVQQKIETRGRHKKDCQCEKCLSKTTKSSSGTSINGGEQSNTRTATGSDKVSKSNPIDFSEYEQNKIVPNEDKPQQFEAAKFISGSLFLMLIDAVFPMILIKVFSMFSPKYKAIQPSVLKLDKNQMKDLEPLANEAVKTLWINLSPMSAFLMATAIIYGGNLLTLDESNFTKS